MLLKIVPTFALHQKILFGVASSIAQIRVKMCVRAWRAGTRAYLRDEAIRRRTKFLNMNIETISQVTFLAQTV